ncbi:MAG: hypothetical protein WC563_15150 [Brevundimonas sp.]
MDTCDEDRCCPTCGADMVFEEVLALIRAEERERIAGELDSLSDRLYDSAKQERAAPWVLIERSAGVKQAADAIRAERRAGK